jgi:hypothetical protein
MKRQYSARIAVALGIAAMLTMPFSPNAYARSGSGGHHGGHSAKSHRGVTKGPVRCERPTPSEDCKAPHGVLPG